jgi:hypothetical protein
MKISQEILTLEKAKLKEMNPDKIRAYNNEIDNLVAEKKAYGKIISEAEEAGDSPHTVTNRKRYDRAYALREDTIINETGNIGQTNAVSQYKKALLSSQRSQLSIAELDHFAPDKNKKELAVAEASRKIHQDNVYKHQQLLDSYDKEAGTLNGIRLTKKQILDLDSYIGAQQEKQDNALQRINNQQLKSRSLLGQIAGGFKASFRNLTDYSLAYAIIGKIRMGIQTTIQYTKELDQALVNLQIVTGQTREETKKLLYSYNQLGKELGATTTEVATASNDWLRAGYKNKEAADLTRASLMLSKLGMIESAQATSYLISSLKGWQLEAKEVVSVVDKLTAVDMAAAISAGDLALAMSRANVSAKVAGSSMEKFIGYTTTIADVSQKSAESVGESKMSGLKVA